MGIGLSEIQYGIYAESVNNEGSVLYNIPMLAELNDDVDIDRLIESLIEIQRIHPALTFRFSPDTDGNIVQEPRDTIPVEVIRLSDDEFKGRSLVRPFDLNGGPLTRFEIYVTPSRSYLYAEFHHTIFDGTSCVVFSQCLSDIYEGKEPKKEIMSVGDIIARERNISDDEKNKDWAFYDGLLSSADVDSIPLRDVHSDVPCEKWMEKKFSIKAEELRTLRKYAGITTTAFFTTVMGITLAGFNGSDKAVFSTVHNGRDEDTQDTMVMMVRTHPFFIDLSDDPSVLDVLKRSYESLEGCHSHTAVSFREICSKYSLNSEINFAYQGKILDVSIFRDHEKKVEYLKDDRQIESSKLIIEISNDGADDYTIHTRYRGDHYSEGFVDSFCRAYISVAAGMIHCDRVSELSLLDGISKERIDSFNDTDKKDVREPIMKRLSDSMSSLKDKDAVVYGDRRVTYGQLDVLSGKIASYIRGKGIGKDDFISVLVPRSEIMTVIAIGILRSGAAYQPLDPSYPKERLNFMVKDASVKLVIADRSLIGMLDGYSGDILYSDEIASLNGNVPSSFPEADDRFTILYTSGTTGTPKGCILAHGNVASYIDWAGKRFETGPDTNYAAYASFGFDANILDTYITLCNGGTLFIVPEDIRLDLAALDRFYTDNGITHSLMTTQVGRQFALFTTCRSLRHLFVGGEKLVPCRPPEWLNLHNMYGPTETTVSVTEFQVKDDNPLLPIGVPNFNVKLYVVGRNGKQLPVGALGEMYIAGPQVSKGYLNRPEKTEQVFIRNPFNDDPKYSRAYRTGDVVRWLPDGNIEYVGRNDGQVKIRGFRIELTEVEKVIREFSGIKDATVAAFNLPSGGKYIAAYIVSDEKIDIHALNDYIGSVKPPYMIPAVTMQIDSIPLNVNGKVDRRKLPQPEMTFDDVTPPQNDIQRRIFDIVAELVGSKGFGIETDLNEAGINSITMIRLNVLLSKEFDVDMQIKDLKENSNIKKLEACILSKSAIKCYDRQEDYPLSKTQEGIFSESLAHPGGTLYNIPLLIRISNELDVQRLKDSIAVAVNAHPQIKATIFLNSDGDIRQRMDDSQFKVDEIELISTALLGDIKDRLVEPFDIVGGRLFRIKIIEADERYLFIDIHHIVSDGTSMDILISDITKAYFGETVDIERYTGFDAALIEQERRSGPEFEQAKGYYEKLLGGCETDILPRPCVYRGCEGSGSVSVDGTDIEDIQAFCSSKGITLNGYVCSAFGLVLSKFCNTEEPVFATIYNGRNDSRLNDTVSMLVKTLPVICRTEGPVDGYVKGISQQLSDSMANDIYSFAEIANEHSFRSDIMLVYQGENFKFDTLCGKGAQLIELPNSESKSRITMQVSLDKGRMHYRCDYDRSMYDDGFISSLVTSFDNTVRSLISAESLSDVSIIDDAQTEMIDGFNDTDVPLDEDRTPMSMISDMISSYPEKDAVVFRDHIVTYGQLGEFIDKIASFIKGKGLGRGDFVSVLSSRNEMMTVSAVGVMRSGAAYQPLDPSYPKERLNFMVKDAGVKLVIAERSLIDKIDEYEGDVLYIDEIPGIIPSDTSFEPAVKSDPFIILYTSGTTGTPKGCILENRNLTAFIQVETEKLEANCEMRYAAYASFGFDANMLDTYVTLCNGGTLYIIPEDMRLDLAEVDRYFIDNGMTHSTMTTQVGRQFMSVTKCKTLRHFVVGGEKLVPFIPPTWVTFHNQYGPSECTVSITDFIVKDDDPLLPIGVPHPNVRLYVVDKYGHQMPVGAVGELYAAGPQVSRGYLNRPEKTEQTYIRNPFSDDPKYSRAYRTGDIVRWLPDGNMDFVGRNDGQVKVRGFRIELTEVEKVIREYEGIKDATVVAFDAPSGGKYLAAYVVSDSKVDADSIAEFIRSRKPPYMVPAAMVQLDRIPLTVNSKVDKRKLPKPSTVLRGAGKLPSNDLEKKLCDIFADVLGLETVYADDNFFSIGGTSISASKLLLQCMNSGLHLVYKNIFSNPTPEQLSRFLNTVPEKKDQTREQISDMNGPLSHNTPEYLDKMKREPIGDVLLVGSTGFLGIHVLAELIKRREGKVYCLIRDSKSQSAEERLRTMMMYYFGGIVDTKALDDVEVIKGDLTDKDLKERLTEYRFDTIINCAAMVKHFAFDDSIERVNYHGVKNLISVALDHKCRFVHVSTTSVAGESVNGSVPENVVLRENTLDIGQNLDNKYVSSKYRAENAILGAIEKDGLRGKIFRAGNLMSRESDGEFQINFNTNSFMKSLKSYKLIGCFPVDDMDVHAEFTPIDATAEALVLLAGTPDEFTVFHGDNCHFIHMANIIESIRRNGMDIDIVSRSEFNERFNAMLSDDKVNSEISGLLSYMGNDGENRRFIGSDNTFTVKALYRLGFSWPIIDNGYIDRVVRSLGTLRFFERR